MLLHGDQRGSLMLSGAEIHMRAALLAIAVVIWSAWCAQAQSLRTFCAAAAKPVQSDSRLSDAVRAVFGPVSFGSKAEECIYPLKVLRYASADVLLTQGNVPGDACHGCSAYLSAYVLRRAGGDLKPVARFVDFAEVGTFGAAGDVSPVTIGGDDGLAIEGGGAFQGYSFTNLDLYVFRSGHVVHLEASPPIAISADDSGARTDGEQPTSVVGSWSVPSAPGNIVEVEVDYKIRAQGRSRVEHLAWTIVGSRLILTRGRLPTEVTKAGGGG